LLVRARRVCLHDNRYRLWLTPHPDLRPFGGKENPISVVVPGSLRAPE